MHLLFCFKNESCSAVTPKYSIAEMVKMIACNLLLQAIQPAKTKLPFNKVGFLNEPCECSMLLKLPTNSVFKKMFPFKWPHFAIDDGKSNGISPFLCQSLQSPWAFRSR